MIHWKNIVSPTDIDTLIENSFETPCLILKHSTTCSISNMAKGRLERGWDFSDKQIQPYFLDLLKFRPISKEIADRFEVHHESPQVLLIQKGICTYDASHLDISIPELKQIMEL